MLKKGMYAVSTFAMVLVLALSVSSRSTAQNSYSFGLLIDKPSVTLKGTIICPECDLYDASAVVQGTHKETGHTHLGIRLEDGTVLAFVLVKDVSVPRDDLNRLYRQEVKIIADVSSQLGIAVPKKLEGAESPAD